MAKRQSPRNARAGSPQHIPGSPRELVVMTSEQAGLRAAPGTLSSVSGASVASLSKLLTKHHAALTPLFGSEERVKRSLSAAAATSENMRE